MTPRTTANVERKRHSVLLIDDDPGTLETLAPILTFAAFDVRTADSGNAALEHVNHRTFTAIVTDVRLPDMTGLSILKHARLRQALVPVIVMTGYATVSLAVEAMKLGASEFIEKPVDGDALVDVVRSSIHHALNVERGAPRDTSVSNLPPSEARQALQQQFARRLAYDDLSLATFIASAEILRRLSIAPSDTSSATLEAIVRDSLADGKPHSNRLHPKVRQAIGELAAADTSTLSLSEDAFAERIGISGAHLGRLLDRETGFGYRPWRRASRLRCATRLLAESAEHIRQIAYQLGCSSGSAFDHEFRAMFGMSPSAFRKLTVSSGT